jgi:hypothetical protein
MAGRVRFYRGAQGTSLPATHQDGAIFIIERTGTNNLGDMYVDMDNGKRLHIVPDSEFITYDSTMLNTTSSLGQVYLFQETGKTGIAVGDGQAYIGDLPVYDSTTKAILQNKVNAYTGSAYYQETTASQRAADGLNAPNDAETLILSREL